MIQKTFIKKISVIISSIFLSSIFYTGVFASDQCYLGVKVGIHNASSTGVETYSFGGLDHYSGDYSDMISIYDPIWGNCSLNTYDSSSTLLQKYSFIDSSYVFGEYYDKATDQIISNSAIQEHSTSTVTIPSDEKTKYLKLSCGDEFTNLAELQPRDLICYTQISSCQELQEIDLNTSTNYILTEDLDCSEVASFKPIAEDTPFTGTLDGNGYIIKNLTINNSEYNYSYVGLFGKLAGKVQGVKIVNANINGNKDTLHLGGGTTGSIAGIQEAGSVIIDSSFNGNINSKWNSGGLVGESNGKIINSNSNGTVTAGYYSTAGSYLSIGGIAGIQGSTGVIDTSCSRSTTTLTGGAPRYTQKSDQIVGESHGQVTGSCAPTPVVQNISNCKQLQDIEQNPDLNYILTKNIDCSGSEDWDYSQGFNPITTFSGKLDGNGYTISNLYIDRPEKANVGLFGSLSGAVSHLGLAGVNITGDSFVGAIAGKLTGGSISTSYSTGNVKGSKTGDGHWSIGGLVGDSTGSISNSFSNANVTGYYAGGLVGIQSSGSISNSYSTGVVSGNKVGGLGAYLGGTVINSYYNSNTSRPTPSWADWVTKNWSKNVGKTTAELKLASTYVGWDFEKVWNISSDTNIGEPYLKGFKIGFSIGASIDTIYLTDYPSKKASFDIYWDIIGWPKSCRIIGDPDDSGWSDNSISTLPGRYNKETKLFSGYGVFGYGIECIGEDTNGIGGTIGLTVKLRR